MSHRDNVEQMIALLQRADDEEREGQAHLTLSDAARWDAARLTYESTRDRSEPDREAPYTMDEWCAQIIKGGRLYFSLSTGYVYRRVWRQFGLHTCETRPSWAEAWRIAQSTTTGQQIDTRARSSARGASPETKREIFQELSRDPAVIEAASEPGSPTSMAAGEMTERAAALRAERRERIVQSDPIATHLERQAAVLDIAAECDRFRRDCRRFAQAIGGLLTAAGDANERDLFWIREAIGDARNALDRLQELIDTGQTDLDAFLQSVLSGERDA